MEETPDIHPYRKVCVKFNTVFQDSVLQILATIYNNIQRMQNKLGQLTQHKTKPARHQYMKPTPFFRLLPQDTTAQFANNLKQPIFLTFTFTYFIQF
jgi:hypothetical protein